jgi:hypothetical protein
VTLDISPEMEVPADLEISPIESPTRGGLFGGVLRVMESARAVRPVRLRARHYHLSDTTIGGHSGYRDDVFPTRREAMAAARERAQWVAALTGLKVQALDDPGRYLLTTGRAHDAGRIIELEDCEDPECLDLAYDSVL